MTSLIDHHLSARIVEARTQLGLSVEDVATRVDLTVQALTDIESGTVRISALAIAQLSRALSLPPRWFYHGLPGQDAIDRTG